MLQDNVQKNCILSSEVIKRKLRRIALQIAENNADEKSMVIAGVNGNGEVLAQKLIGELKNIIAADFDILTIRLNKKDPLNVTIDQEEAFTDKVIIIVDDVSNTGRTLLYALKPFLQQLPKKIQTAVLVERSHKLYAVQPDYVGLSVSTTLKEHISVEVDNNEFIGAFLQ
jgi:pyrimidine operon attenuation protein/uracil phosphoribosyltransferase